MTPIEIVQTIKARRTSLGLSQQEVADRLGIHRQSYERIENGRSSPTLQSIISIAEAMDLEIDIRHKNNC